MKNTEYFNLINTTKAKLPRLAFVDMKEAVLGKKYVLSLHIVSRKRIQELNNHYRKIDAPTDILSFPISDNEGEMFINIQETKKESKKFDRNFENFLGFLFIHGLVHLKGYDHGSTMEEIEREHRLQFGI